MRLSEAMQLGAMWKPQGFDDFFELRDDGVVATCALGAVLDACGQLPVDECDMDVCDECLNWSYPFLMTLYAPCPSCQKTDLAGAIIAHLNDKHFWTREAIAAWVATIEPQDAIEETLTPVLVHQEHGV